MQLDGGVVGVTGNACSLRTPWSWGLGRDPSRFRIMQLRVKVRVVILPGNFKKSWIALYDDVISGNDFARFVCVVKPRTVVSSCCGINPQMNQLTQQTTSGILDLLGLGKFSSLQEKPW